MATTVNIRDTFLAAEAQRLSVVPENFITLTSPSTQFKVDTSGVPDVTSIIITANLVGRIYGTCSFSVISGSASVTDNGNNTVTVTFSGMLSNYITIRASLSCLGAVYTRDIVIYKVYDGAAGPAGSAGAAGSRGSVTSYITGTVWSDSSAQNAIYSQTSTAYLVPGDTVTISNGTSFAATKYWNGTTWQSPGTVIDGGLLVNGTLTADKIGTGTISSNITMGGTFIVNSTGSIYSAGKTSYASTTAGFWLGYDSTTYKFNIGSSTAYLKWTGTDLSVKGTIDSGSTISGATISGSTITGGSININSGQFQVATTGDCTIQGSLLTTADVSSTGKSTTAISTTIAGAARNVYYCLRGGNMTTGSAEVNAGVVGYMTTTTGVYTCGILGRATAASKGIGVIGDGALYGVYAYNATSTGSALVAVNASTGVAGTFSASGSGISSSSSGSGYGVYGVCSGTAIGVLGDATTATGTNHGLAGRNSNRGTLGIVGPSRTDCDFYASGIGVYLPFTGAHEGLLDKTTNIIPGDLLVDEKILYKKGISDCSGIMNISTVPNQKGIVGVFTVTMEIEEGSLLASARQSYELDLPDNIMYLKDDYVICSFNAIGEGQINVCGEAGNIDLGDLIVSSSMPGKGMKQYDDIIRNYTVAKSREAVTFDYPEQVKQIACIYLCG